MKGDETIVSSKDVRLFGKTLRFEFSEKGSVQITVFENNLDRGIFAQLSNQEFEKLVRKWRVSKGEDV